MLPVIKEHSYQSMQKMKNAKLRVFIIFAKDYRFCDLPWDKLMILANLLENVQRR